MGFSPGIKVALGFAPDTDDKMVQKDWSERIKQVCKPCWELKYCPYGPLVEQFPLLPPTRHEAIEHNKFLKKQIAKQAYDKGRRKIFEEEIKNFNAKDYPEKISQEELECSCTKFGHMCPVFVVNEPFTETKERRKIGRHISFKTKIRVARRDNYTCQICGKHLKDQEIEFDHIIPISKGGSSEERNIRLTCFACNRDKDNQIDL